MSDKDYKFKAKMCNRLSRELDEEDMREIVEKIECVAPKTYGLQNSESILPSYYNFANKPAKEVSNIDYLKIIEHDICDMRRLKPFQLEYIKDLNDKSKFHIIKLFNEVIGNICDFID